jgi:hypothetical protein
MRYVSEVAPAIGLHAPVARAQRNHRQVALGGGSPVHVAPAVRDSATCAVPVITGPEVIFGAESARAAAGGRAATQAAVTSAAQPRHTAGRRSSIAARLSGGA